MKKKKSSLFFMPLIVIILIIVLVNLYIVLLEKGSFTKPIGSKQFDLFKVYSKAESALFYIDQSAKYALQQSVYELAQNGGITGIAGDEPSSEENVIIPNNGCGNYYGYNLWYTENNNCFNENKFKNNLKFLFIKKLNQYLTASPYNIQRDNYEYEIKDGLEIIGKAIFPLNFYILKDEKKPIFKKPTEIKLPENQETFIDFTDTELCAKGTRCRLTKEAYDLLLKSQEIAKQKGVSLEVTSAYRTLVEQNILWERNPNSGSVCPPSPTCPHLTGKAVDIKIKEKIDWVLLHKIMSETGWVRYSGEKLHFECCGTTRYAQAKELEKKTGQPVTVIA